MLLGVHEPNVFMSGILMTSVAIGIPTAPLRLSDRDRAVLISVESIMNLDSKGHDAHCRSKPVRLVASSPGAYSY